MSLIGVDVGTTHCKAGLFLKEGTIIRTASKRTIIRQDSQGFYYLDPEELWNTVASVIREVAADESQPVLAIGIASMAETGLLVDRMSGEARTELFPWFDQRSAGEAETIANADEPLNLFVKTGLRASFKSSLSKLLWIRRHRPDALRESVWLSVSDYIACRLTGAMATDYTLAGRTFAFDIRTMEWDEAWIRYLGLPSGLFPAALPSGTAVGTIAADVGGRLHLTDETQVFIAGHDHVCASLAVGAVAPGSVYDSIGTAETLVGTIGSRRLGGSEYHSGLSYGIHVLPGRMYWMGGISASGGSVEWIRSLLSDSGLSYEQLIRLLDQANEGPSGILYYPYLSGSGSPLPDPQAKGAFIGLQNSHTKADLIKAVLEGTAFELEAIRRAAEKAINIQIRQMTAVGGGTRNPHWMQAKADITGSRIDIAPVSEATLLGAAMIAGIGSGVYAGEQEAAGLAERSGSAASFLPEASRSAKYAAYYEAYSALQKPLRQSYHNLFKERS